MQVGEYQVDILSQGFPGKSLRHGWLGWSTVTLLRGHGRVCVVDTGAFNLRRRLVEALAEHGLGPADVTDVLLSHLHFDHVENWPLFTRARLVVGATELAWACGAGRGELLLPELSIAALAADPRLDIVTEGDMVLPGVRVHPGPGHTPGHLIFMVEGAERDLILVQDAAKYRAELLTRSADMTIDPAVSTATIDRIWELWARKEGSIVLPGHDLPMVLENGVPTPIGHHEAGVAALFGESIDALTVFPFVAG